MALEKTLTTLNGGGFFWPSCRASGDLGAAQGYAEGTWSELQVGHPFRGG